MSYSTNRFAVLADKSMMEDEEKDTRHTDPEMKTYDSADDGGISGAESSGSNITRNQGRQTQDYRKLSGLLRKNEKKILKDDSRSEKTVSKSERECEKTQKLRLLLIEKELSNKRDELKDMKQKYKAMKHDKKVLAEEIDIKKEYYENKYLELEEKHTEMLKMSCNLQEELSAERKINKMLTDQIEAMEKKQQEHKNDEPETESKQIMTIMDSNGKYLIPTLREMLSEYEIDSKIGIYNTGNLLHYLSRHRPQKKVLILMGTNDLDEVSSREIISNILDIARLELPNITFITIPPQKRDKNEEINDATNLEREHINRTIKKYFNVVEVQELEEEPEKYLIKDDGYHLNQEATDIIAGKIMQHYTSNIKNPDITVAPLDSERGNERKNRCKTIRESIIIQREVLNHVIGRNKNNQYLMCERHNASMSYVHSEDDNTSTIIIESKSKAGVEGIIEEINGISEKRERIEHLKEKKSHIVCRDYKNGNCMYEDHCWYYHPKEQLDSYMQNNSYDNNQDYYTSYEDNKHQSKQRRHHPARQAPYEKDREDNQYETRYKKQYTNSKYAETTSTWRSHYRK